MKFEVVSPQRTSDDLDALVHELAAFLESDTIVCKVLAPGTETCTETDTVARNDRK